MSLQGSTKHPSKINYPITAIKFNQIPAPLK